MPADCISKLMFVMNNGHGPWLSGEIHRSYQGALATMMQVEGPDAEIHRAGAPRCGSEGVETHARRTTEVYIHIPMRVIDRDWYTQGSVY